MCLLAWVVVNQLLPASYPSIPPTAALDCGKKGERERGKKGGRAEGGKEERGEEEGRGEKKKKN